MREVLVLNAALQPVGRVSWIRAVSDWYVGRVKILEVYADRVIRSVSFEIQMPAVVMHLHHAGPHRRAIRFSRDNVYLRDKGCCQYCGLKLHRNSFTFDHVLPRARGGKTEWDNVVLACGPCNALKQDRTPEEARMRLLNKPVRPRALPDLTAEIEYEPGMPDEWKAYLVI